MILLDYRCFSCGRTEERLESRPAPAFHACECGSRLERVITGGHLRIPTASVVRGKSEEPPPWAMDYRAFAEGRGHEERARLRKLRRDATWRRAKELVG